MLTNYSRRVMQVTFMSEGRCCRRRLPAGLVSLLLVVLITPGVVGPAARASEPAPARTQRRGQANKIRSVQPNAYAPDLYAESLTFKLKLVGLPGAREAESDCEVRYQLYFIPEEEFNRVTRAARPGGDGLPDFAEFAGKILLAEGTFKPRRLDTLKARSHARRLIRFKSAVPAPARTKLGVLATRYSVKVNDARLNKMVFGTGTFIAHPFDDTDDTEREVARTTVYLNFFVAEDGELFRSQLPRDDVNTSW